LAVITTKSSVTSFNEATRGRRLRCLGRFDRRILSDKEYPDQQHDNGAGDGIVGDVERPPTFQFTTEQAHVGNIHIDKVDYLAEADAIDDIPQRPAGEKPLNKLFLWFGLNNRRSRSSFSMRAVCSKE